MHQAQWVDPRLASLQAAVGNPDRLVLIGEWNSFSIHQLDAQYSWWWAMQEAGDYRAGVNSLAQCKCYVGVRNGCGVFEPDSILLDDSCLTPVRGGVGQCSGC